MPRLSARVGSAKFLVVFLVIAVLGFGIEHLVEHVTAETGFAQKSVFDARFIYNHLVTSWPRREKPRYTEIVRFDSRPVKMRSGADLVDPEAVDGYQLCAQRRRTAELMDRLAAAGPAVIVLDKFYLAGPCAARDGDAGAARDVEDTRALQEAIRRVAATIPVIVALAIDVPKGTKPGPEEALPIRPPLDFPGAVRLREGIANLDLDTRRAPLGWYIRRGGSDRSWTQALALEAAAARDTRLLEHPRLHDLVMQREHPYVSLIDPDQFSAYHVGDLFCGRAGASEALSRWCRERGVSTERLRGQVVVVGEISEQDVHESAYGRVPGVVLQANYIEALLDERFFTPAPWWVNLLVGFFFFVAVQLALELEGWWKPLAFIALSVVVTLLLLAFVIRFFYYYINPVTFSSLVLCITLADWLLHRLRTIMEKEHGATA